MVMAFVVNQRPFPNAKSHQPAKALTGFPQRPLNPRMWALIVALFIIQIFRIGSVAL